MKSKILTYHAQLINQTISVQNVFEEIKKQLIKNQNANPIINNCFDTAQASIDQLNLNSKSVLNGVFYALKDNITTTTHPTTGGSKFLENYYSPFNATVYEKLENAKAINVAKANLDEFGLGGSGTHSAFGIVPNYLDNQYLIGGSSSGSCYLVQANIVLFSIGTDTGDSIRKPASYAGIVGFKPSYGLISRYGVYPFCPSLDTVGIFSHYVLDAAIVLNAIAGADENDATCWKTTTCDYTKELLNPIKTTWKIGIFKNLFAFEPIDQMPNCNWHQTKKKFDNLIIELQKNSAIEIIFLNFKEEYLKSINAMYLVIAYAEAASCYANLTGVTFGPKLKSNNFYEAIANNRNLLGNEFKNRMIIGAASIDPQNYHDVYLQAKLFRELIQTEVDLILNLCDCVLLPSAFGTSFLLSEYNNNIKIPNNNIDNVLQIANFYGLPSITIPWIKIANLPVGLNIFSNFKNDQMVLNLAGWLEKWLISQKDCYE